MDLELNGKTALVTGGSRGIGKAVALQLAREGADVVISARGRAALESAAAELAAASGRIIVPIVADTGDDESVAAMVEAAAKALGGVDILVNNAARPGGQVPNPPLEGITGELLWQEVNVKNMGYLRCAQRSAPHMKRRGWGRIINISGLAARNAGSTVGSMRNAAIVAMTKNLANELGPYGITVNVVHPGSTRTEASAELIARLASERGVDEAEIEREFASETSVRRFIDASDIAHVAAFLASPKSIAINGETIGAGGGAGVGIYY